jgi:hypothetical protein
VIASQVNDLDGACRYTSAASRQLSSEQVVDAREYFEGIEGADGVETGAGCAAEVLVSGELREHCVARKLEDFSSQIKKSGTGPLHKSAYQLEHDLRLGVASSRLAFNPSGKARDVKKDDRR